MADKQFDWTGLLQFAPSVLGAGAGYLGASPMREEAERLRRERERLLAEGAPGLTALEQEQLNAARARAATSRVPGYAQEVEGIAQQQGDVLAAGKRGSQTSSNLLNLLSKLNVQGQAARRNLAMRGAQTQQQAQRELGSIAMSADARRVQREQLRERQLAAMDAAARQYKAQAGMAPLQGAISMMPASGFDFTKLMKDKAAPPTVESVRFNPETDVSLGDEMNVSNARVAASSPAPSPAATGLGGQFNMSEDIGYDPYKEPLKKYPILSGAYQNMFNPDMMRRRMDMVSQLPRTTPYYNFGQ
jgi:hypothetical protein